MSTTFRRIQTVAPGDKITSLQRNGLANGLADGINDRLRSGLGSGTFRAWNEVYSLFRDMLAAPDENSFPEKDVWLARFANIPWGDASSEWPGEGDTLNFFNPLLAFIYGSAGYDLVDESRLNDIEAAPFSTARAAWEQGKQQRGYIDLETGSENSPTFMSARWQRKLPSGYPWLVKYGGYVPTAPPVGRCSTVGNPVVYEYTFTPVRSGLPIVTYRTACPVAGDDGLTLLEETDDGYLISLQISGSRKLLFTDYVLGPNRGEPALSYTSSDLMEHVLYRTAADFRGTSAERANDQKYRVQRSAFDFQKFLTSQYFLAPAQATDDRLGHLAPTGYPLFNFPGPPGLVSLRSGYCLAGYRIKTHHAGGGTLSIGEEGDFIFLKVDLPIGDVEKIVWLPHPPSVAGNYTIFTSDLTNWEDDATLEVELAILEKTTPSLNDAYVVLRRSSADAEKEFDNRGQDYPSAPKVSSDYFAHGCIFAAGAIAAQTSESLEPIKAVNTNPVHEAAREFFRERMRFVKRESFKGYAVENGRSVLWFSRTVNVGGRNFDLFDGIAPPVTAIQSGHIQAGIRYRTSGAPVTYNKVEVPDGEEFVGVDGVTTFNITAGQVFQVNGIVITAPPAGSTNEWLMFLTTNIYSDSDSSDLKPEAYGDVATFLHNRCLFDSPDALGHAELFAHLAPGLNTLPPIYTPAPSSDNYAEAINSMPGENALKRAAFFSSCPIYKPDYEIESAELTVSGPGPNILAKVMLDGFGDTVEFPPVITGVTYVWTPAAAELLYSVRKENDDSLTSTLVSPGQFIAEDYVSVVGGPANSLAPGDVHQLAIAGGEVKLTFKTRFQNTGAVAGDLARGSAFTAEAYRTDENALREYILGNCSSLVGDAAAALDVYSIEGTHGSCHPRFYFTQLMTKVREEKPVDLDTPDPKDTRCFSADLNYATFLLSCMCEGYLDPLADPVITECGQRPGNYTFPALCFQIDGTFSRFPMIQRSLNGGKGFGPVPNTIMYAELFNALAKGFNLLTKVPVELPYTAHAIAKTYRKIADCGVTNLTVDPGAGDNCHGLPPDHWYAGAFYLYTTEGVLTVPEVPGDLVATGAPTGYLNLTASRGGSIYGEQHGAGPTYSPVVDCDHDASFMGLVEETQWEIRVAFELGPVLPNLAGLFETSAALTARRTNSYHWWEITSDPVDVSTGVKQIGSNANFIKIKEHNSSETICDVVPVSGELSDAVFTLKAPDFHASIVALVQTGNTGDPGNSSVGVASSINPTVNVLIATVPLV